MEIVYTDTKSGLSYIECAQCAGNEEEDPTCEECGGLGFVAIEHVCLLSCGEGFSDRNDLLHHMLQEHGVFINDDTHVN